jgi:quercetin dioxygenase-like cupin family protein
MRRLKAAPAQNDLDLDTDGTSYLPTMEPTFLIAHLVAQRSLDGLAFSALPDAPVRPPGRRRRLAGRRARSAADRPQHKGEQAMTTTHVSFEDAEWMDLGRGVAMAPLRIEGRGAGTAYLRFERGGTSPAHRHPAGEDLYVIRGRLRVGDLILEAQDFLHTPPGEAHDAEAHEETLVLVSVPEPIEFLE